jgi:hypothetical protein
MWQQLVSLESLPVELPPLVKDRSGKILSSGDYSRETP